MPPLPFSTKEKILIISTALAAGLGRKGMGTDAHYQQRSPARIPIRAESRSARREGRGKLKVHLYKAVTPMHRHLHIHEEKSR